MEDDKHIEIADWLIESLQKCTGLIVQSNLRDTPDEPVSWLNKRLKSCQDVVLVFTPLGKINYQKNQNDPFTIGVNMLLQERKKNFLRQTTCHKFFAVYFDDDITTCIPETVLSQNVKCLLLQKNFAGFFKILAKKQLQEVPENQIAILKDKLNSINSKIGGSLLQII